LYGAIAGDPSLTLQEKTRRFGSLPLLYQPGTEWKYSIATDILGDLIERVSGMGLEEFLRSRVFDPLGMNDTGFHVAPDKADRVVSIYRATQEEDLEVVTRGPALSELKPPRAPSGAGGLFSTPLDYLRFAQMLLNRGEFGGIRIINEETVERMIRDQLPPGVALPDQFGANYGLTGYGFGLGFRVRKNVEESGLRGNVGEFGWAGAYETYFLVDPSEELVGLFMTQVQPSGHYPLRREFTNLVYASLARRP
jgi:CubicO group peptidase (beta-lactamase class C family)